MKAQRTRSDATGDPRLDKNPFFQGHVQGAVEKQLAAKGFERSTAATPDLLIHYHASINQRIDVNRADRGYGYCYDEDCQTRVFEYEAGTVVLDIVDARTNRVIWRGWAQDSMEGVLDHPDRMERQINEAVTRAAHRCLRKGRYRAPVSSKTIASGSIRAARGLAVAAKA